jgi:hypothetical protein
MGNFLFNFLDWIKNVKKYFFFKYLNILLLPDLCFTAPWGATAPLSLRSTVLDNSTTAMGMKRNSALKFSVTFHYHSTILYEKLK